MSSRSENETPQPETPDLTQSPTKRKRNSLKLAWSKVIGIENPSSSIPSIEPHSTPSSSVHTLTPVVKPSKGKAATYSTHNGIIFTGSPLTAAQWALYFAQEKELEEARAYVVRAGVAFVPGVFSVLEEKVREQEEIFIRWRVDNWGTGDFVQEGVKMS